MSADRKVGDRVQFNREFLKHLVNNRSLVIGRVRAVDKYGCIDVVIYCAPEDVEDVQPLPALNINEGGS